MELVSLTTSPQPSAASKRSAAKNLVKFSTLRTRSHQEYVKYLSSVWSMRWEISGGESCTRESPRVSRRWGSSWNGRLQGAGPRSFRRVRKWKIHPAVERSTFFDSWDRGNLKMVRNHTDRQARRVLPGGGGRGRREEGAPDAPRRIRAHHGAERVLLSERHHPQPHPHRGRPEPRHIQAINFRKDRRRLPPPRLSTFRGSSRISLNAWGVVVIRF